MRGRQRVAQGESASPGGYARALGLRARSRKPAYAPDLASPRMRPISQARVCGRQRVARGESASPGVTRPISQARVCGRQRLAKGEPAQLPITSILITDCR